jgi:Ni/Fe-hydrogenase 1 B-type cytochrome subunit
MSTPSGKLFPVYVWQVPVRIWHWVMATCMVVLAITGYLIGSPPPSVGGEASNSFLFGYIRFTHFSAALIFVVAFVLRLLWVVIGNRFAREIFSVPLKMLSGRWWAGLVDQTKYYLFIKREAQPWQGHNPLAMAAMFFMYVLGALFMILTGLALYGEGLGRESWIFQAFSSWVLPLLGYSQNVHTLHHLGMWYLIVFVIAHVYMVVREDIFSEVTVISTMINGWRVAKK